MAKFKVAIAGLGNRGRDTYGRFILDNAGDMVVTAVADIDSSKRKEAQSAFGLSSSACYSTAEEMFLKDKLSDIAFICTPDDAHYKHAIAALDKGYHLLLEKPIAVTKEQCVEITKLAKEKDRRVIVCHVLRYTPFYSAINQVIKSGEIGDFVTLNTVENVGYYHHAHSFVRGNWGNTQKSSPMILAKCCHDLDAILWLTGKSIETVSSYGDLHYFKADKAPEGAAKRCLDGCSAKETCPYDAEKIYLPEDIRPDENGHLGWPADVLVRPATKDSVLNALKTGPYGRCVFHCDNDAVDHQVVNIAFKDGTTAHLTMSAFSADIYRTVQVMGTLGMIEADMRTNTVTVSVFGKKTRVINANTLEAQDGHGGGDIKLFESLSDVLSNPSEIPLTDISHSITSHLACFAAEQSRQNGGKPVGI
ncbi:MAG: Gfo/Idh/MocA family oxidoreductase [Oscillospiraceae bacterium]|nr:Gfo/Idh/MocA family oxidoreductase [Oscillospiraceae bacterium]